MDALARGLLKNLLWYEERETGLGHGLSCRLDRPP